MLLFGNCNVMELQMPVTEPSLPVWHRAIRSCCPNKQHRYVGPRYKNLVVHIIYIYIEFARCRLLVTNRPHFVVIWTWQMRNSFVSTKTPLGTRQYYTITALFPVQSRRNQYGTHRQPWLSYSPVRQWRWRRDTVNCTKMWNLRYSWFRCWKRCRLLLNSLAHFGGCLTSLDKNHLPVM
jgi:hypothetical protein